MLYPVFCLMPCEYFIKLNSKFVPAQYPVSAPAYHSTLIRPGSYPGVSRRPCQKCPYTSKWGSLHQCGVARELCKTSLCMCHGDSNIRATITCILHRHGVNQAFGRVLFGCMSIGELNRWLGYISKDSNLDALHYTITVLLKGCLTLNSGRTSTNMDL